MYYKFPDLLHSSNWCTTQCGVDSVLGCHRSEMAGENYTKMVYHMIWGLRNYGNLVILFTQSPSRFEQNGLIGGYLVEYRASPINNASNSTYHQLNITANSTDTLDTVYRLNLTGLVGDMVYDVRILAYNRLGVGPYSNVVSAQITIRE